MLLDAIAASQSSINTTDAFRGRIMVSSTSTSIVRVIDVTSN